MARTLVTGAAGFIGSALTRALARAGHEVIALRRTDGDVTEKATWARLARADHVFHLAARSYVPDSWRDPAGFFSTNISGTIQALEYCRANGAHLVFASGYVYGLPTRLPIREDDPTAPNNPYALSKFLAEQICAFYAATGALVTVVRPFNIYGSGQRRMFLIPTILEQVRTGGEIRVKDLAPRRDYLYVDDLMAALIEAMKNPGGHRVFNIGSGVSYSVREVIDTIQAVAGTSLPVVSEDAPRPNEISDVRADITRAQTVLGWNPRYSFAEGIARMLEDGRSASVSAIT
jgi:GDP-4-dehydro-6-deoxy-D-mannose reductase